MKNVHHSLAILSILLLTSCESHRSALHNAIEQCQLNGGINYVVFSGDDGEFISCQNADGRYIKKRLINK